MCNGPVRSTSPALFCGSVCVMTGTLTNEDVAVPPHFVKHELHLLEGEAGLPPLEAHPSSTPSPCADVGVPRHCVQYRSPSTHTLDSTAQHLDCKQNG